MRTSKDKSRKQALLVRIWFHLPHQTYIIRTVLSKSETGSDFFIEIWGDCKMPQTSKRASGTDTKNRLSIPISLFFARPLLGSVLHLHRTAGLKYSRQSFLLPMFVHEPLIDA